jgi:hypothetical protein
MAAVKPKMLAVATDVVAAVSEALLTADVIP